jgi:hypothetical protein
VGEPTVTKSKKGVAGPEFNKEHAFFFMKGIFHRQFFHPNTAVNSDFYYVILRSLRENVLQKRLELWRNHNWLLHHDSAAAHISLKTTEFVTWLSFPILPNCQT